MTDRTFSLVITTPLDVLAQADAVTSFRADDDSGSFGVLPGHADLLAVLRDCVARWREGEDGWRYCALHGGVMTVEEGSRIRIACREGVLGDDVETLEAEVRRRREAALQAASRERVNQAKLHARAIRQIMRHLSSDHGISVDTALDEIFQ
ncbi:F0F1 ATP synthase subunit epsilon [Oricola sp.]|uniref:F0F1 ATP synthase subunit epsilon n=1 Tax=Oricola sp. TaxID=1979950 RepID=UPI0025DD1775|nr:F0F1 ATP synthase subunit epsilon [Oricola sp.]MCI5074569.1 F0F1 ATP synthase subunit epsilon [Oricola sp.]